MAPGNTDNVEEYRELKIIGAIICATLSMAQRRANTFAMSSSGKNLLTYEFINGNGSPLNGDTNMPKIKKLRL